MQDLVEYVKRPSVEFKPPNDGDLLVELLIFDRHPLTNHWAYWISSEDDEIGVKVRIRGDSRYGYYYEASRSHCLYQSGNVPTERIPLQWVSSQYFEWEAMINYGHPKQDRDPVGPFEKTACLAEPPGSSLPMEDVGGGDTGVRNIKYQARIKNSEEGQILWILRSVEELAKACIFKPETVRYLRILIEGY